MFGPSADDYRKFARQCTEWAVNAATDQDRETFLELARDWTFAALSLDRNVQPRVPHKAIA
jgi:hypothetical protein